MWKNQKGLFCLFAVCAYALTVPASYVVAAEEDSSTPHDSEVFDYLYGNHTCPACPDADAVDPHFFADVKNKKGRVFARIYVCTPSCAKEIEKNMGKFYMSVYRTDKKNGKEIPARDLKNQVCPVSGDKIDGKTSIEYNGMIVSFCCEDCVESFLKDPEPGMRKLLPDAKEFKFEGDSDHEDHDHDHEENENK